MKHVLLRSILILSLCFITNFVKAVPDLPEKMNSFRAVPIDTKMPSTALSYLSFGFGPDGSLFIGRRFLDARVDSGDEERLEDETEIEEEKEAVRETIGDSANLKAEGKNERLDKEPIKKFYFEVIKLDSKGSILWRKRMIESKPAELAATPDGGVAVAFSSHNPRTKVQNPKYSYILFLDKNGEVRAEWNKPEKPFRIFQIFSLKPAPNGDVLFLCMGYPTEISNAQPIKQRPLVGCIDSSGREKWMIDSNENINPFFLTVSPRSFVSSLMVRYHKDATLLMGARMGSDMPFSLQDLKIPYKDRPVAMTSSLEENGKVYVVFEEEKEKQRTYRIDKFYLLDKRGPQITTVAHLPADKISFKQNVNAAAAWAPKLTCEIVSLPNGKFALLDGWRRTRLTIFDPSGKILSQHEYTGKGTSTGDLLSYDTKANTIQIAGRTGSKEKMYSELSEPFWIQLKLQ